MLTFFLFPNYSKRDKLQLRTSSKCQLLGLMTQWSCNSSPNPQEKSDKWRQQCCPQKGAFPIPQSASSTWRCINVNNLSQDSNLSLAMPRNLQFSNGREPWQDNPPEVQQSSRVHLHMMLICTYLSLTRFTKDCRSQLQKSSSNGSCHESIKPEQFCFLLLIPTRIIKISRSMFDTKLSITERAGYFLI